MAVSVQVDLNANTKKVDAALARIQAQAKGVDFGGGARSLEKLSRPLGKITGQASEFQKSLEASNARVLAFGASVAVINKLSESFGALVANTIKVEASFAKIGVILGGTEDQLQQFGQGIFQVAKATATSFDQVADGALELARQGLSVEESLNRVETALKLVRVAGIDSEQAVAGLTAAIKGFESQGITVTQIADKLAEVDTKFAVSTEDLINGLERASASARVAGVSFDELLGLITTVQERTQRGGAVIGNAFKTIFARLGRTDTLVALEELGINVLDAEGNVRSAVPLFIELGQELDKLGLKSVAAGDIIQKVAGVRQRDILISLVEDLNAEQSQFAKSLLVSASAAGALDQKNTKLNETLEALINNLIVSGQELAATLGEIGFADAAGNILEAFSKVVNGITNVLDGEGIGSTFARGLVKGIGGVLTGPGLTLVGAIFIKLFADLAKFGAKSLTSILGINKASEQQKILQQSVLQTLLQNENIQREILKLEGNKVAQEQLLLKIYNQQAAALSRVQKAAAVVTPGLFGKGFRGGSGGVGRAAGGYVAAESRDVSRGVGGAPANSKVVSIPNFAFGGGKRGTMVANSSEYFVPNYAGGGDAIFNQDMVRSMGLPAGAKKLNASGGYIPNFASAAQMSAAFQRLPQADFIKKFGRGEFNLRQRAAATGTTASERKRRAEGLRKGRGKGSDAIYDPRYAMIVPGGRTGQVSLKRKGYNVAFDVVGYAGDEKRRLRNDEQLTKATEKYALGLANSEARKMGGPPRADKISKLANSGAISALAGTVFETAVSSLLASDDFDARSQIAAFDYVGKGDINKLRQNLFPGLSPLAQFVEAKIRPSRDNKRSMADKILKDRGLVQKAANGYIPNFAQEQDPLNDAIGREMAAGLSPNQIRINQSGKLRNSQNPLGLAVTNTRDEPTGRIPNFAKGGRGGEGIGSGGLLLASTGLFALSSALGDAEDGLGKFVSGLSLGLSVLTTLSLLSGPVQSLSGKMQAFGNGLTKNVTEVGKYGTELKTFQRTGIGGLIAGFGKMLPVIGTIVSIGVALAPMLSSFGLFENQTDRAAQALADLEKSAREASDAEKQTLITAKEKEVAEKQAAAKAAAAAVDSRIPKQGGGVGTRFGISQDVAVQGARQGNVAAEAQRAAEQAENELAALRKIFAESETGQARGFEAGTLERVTAAGASKVLRESALPGGRLAAEGFGAGAGDRTRVLEQELALAKAITTVEKVGLENSIAQLKFDIEARKQRFAITERFVSELKKGDDISAKGLQIVKERVEAGDDLFEIEKALLDAGVELTPEVQKLLDLDKNRLDALNQRLAGQQLEIDNQKKINDLKTDKTFSEGLRRGVKGLEEETSNFQRELGENMPKLFADNLSQGLRSAITEAENLGDALKGAARGFLETLAGNFLDQAANQISQSLFNSIQGGASSGNANLFGGLFGGGGGGSFFGNLFGGFSFFNSGGSVGRGTDTVPAMLTPGEFVVKKSSVDKYGTGFLSALNNGTLPMKGFQDGGSIAPVSAEIGSSVSGGNSVTNNSNFSFSIEGGKASGGAEAGAGKDQEMFAQRIRSAVTTIIQEESRTGGTLSYLGKK